MRDYNIILPEVAPLTDNNKLSPENWEEVEYANSPFSAEYEKMLDGLDNNDNYSSYFLTYQTY